MSRSITVGMPNCRIPFPPGLGISTLRTGCGWYLPSSSSSLMRLQCSRRQALRTSTVTPSTPAEPLFASTRRSALNMFSRSTTASINCIVFRREASFLAVRLDAQATGPCGFRPLLPEDVPAVSVRLSASPFLIEIQGSCHTLHVRAFSPVDGPTMPSADFCRPIPPPLDSGSTGQIDRPPRVMRTHLHAYARRIYVHAFCTGIGL